MEVISSIDIVSLKTLFALRGTHWVTPERLQAHIRKFDFLSKKQNVTCRRRPHFKLISAIRR